jgi:hypothetical protein
METGFGKTGFGLRDGVRAAGCAMLLGAICAVTPVVASELNPLEVTLVQSSGDKYFEPAGRRIVVRFQPINLAVRIRNTSSSSRLVRANPELAYAIELKDQKGLTVMVQRKKGARGEGRDDIRVNLAPGADKIVPMEINRDTWDGVPDIAAGKESQYTARVVYETADGKHIYSESYTLVFHLL